MQQLRRLSLSKQATERASYSLRNRLASKVVSGLAIFALSLSMAVAIVTLPALPSLPQFPWPSFSLPQAQAGPPDTSSDTSLFPNDYWVRSPGNCIAEIKCAQGYLDATGEWYNWGVKGEEILRNKSVRFAFQISLSALPSYDVPILKPGNCETTIFVGSKSCLIFGGVAFDVIGINKASDGTYGTCFIEGWLLDRGGGGDYDSNGFADGRDCPENTATLLLSAVNGDIFPQQPFRSSCPENNDTCNYYINSDLKKSLDTYYTQMRNFRLEGDPYSGVTSPTIGQLIISRTLEGGEDMRENAISTHSGKVNGPNVPNVYFYPIAFNDVYDSNGLPGNGGSSIDYPDIYATDKNFAKTEIEYYPLSASLDNKTRWSSEDTSAYWLRSRCLSDTYPRARSAASASAFNLATSVQGANDCTATDYANDLAVTARPLALLKTDGAGVSAAISGLIDEFSIGACLSQYDASNYNGQTNRSCIRFGETLWDIIGMNQKGVNYGVCNLPAGAFWSDAYSSDAECVNNSMLIALSPFTNQSISSMDSPIDYNYENSNVYLNSLLDDRMNMLYDGFRSACFMEDYCIGNPSLEQMIVERELICQDNTMTVTDPNKCMKHGDRDANPVVHFYPPSAAEVGLMSTKAVFSFVTLAEATPQTEVKVKNYELGNGYLKVNLEGGSGSGNYFLSDINGCEVLENVPNGEGVNNFSWTLKLGHYATYCNFKFGRYASDGYPIWQSDNTLSIPDIYTAYKCRAWNYNYTGQPPNNDVFPENGEIVEHWALQISQTQIAEGKGFKTQPIFEDKIGEVDNNLCQREGYKQIGWSKYPSHEVNIDSNPERIWPGDSFISTSDLESGSWNYDLYPVWAPRPQKIQYYNPYAGPASVGDLVSAETCQYSKLYTLPNVDGGGYNFLGWSYTDPGGFNADGSINKHVDVANEASTYTCLNSSESLLADGSVPVKKLYAVWGKNEQASLTLREWHYADQDFTGMQADGIYPNHPQQLKLDFNGGTGTGAYTEAVSQTLDICQAGSVTDKNDSGHYGQSLVTLTKSGLCRIKLKRIGSFGLTDREDIIETQVYSINFSLQSWGSPSWIATRPATIYYIGTINAGLPSLLDLTDATYPTNLLVSQDGVYNKDGMWRTDGGYNRRGQGQYLAQANQYGYSANITHTFTSQSVELYPEWESRTVEFFVNNNSSGLLLSGTSIGTCLYNGPNTQSSGYAFRPTPNKPADVNGYVGLGYSLSPSTFTPGVGNSSLDVTEHTANLGHTCYNTVPVAYPTALTPQATRTLYAVYQGQAPPKPSGTSLTTSFTEVGSFAKMGYSIPAHQEGNAVATMEFNYCYADTAAALVTEGSGTCTLVDGIDPDDSQPVAPYNIASINGKYLKGYVRTSNPNGQSAWLASSTVLINFPTYTITFDASTGRPAGTLLQNVSPSSASGVPTGSAFDTYFPSISPILVGYDFAGWRKGLSSNSVYNATTSGTVSNCGGEAASGSNIFADITLHACWLARPNSTVTFNLGTLPAGASSTATSPQTESVEHHAEVLSDSGIGAQYASKTLKASFDGWYTEDECAGSAVTFPYDISGNTNFYACWQQEADVKVTYHLNFSEDGAGMTLKSGVNKIFRFDSNQAGDAPDINPLIDGTEDGEVTAEVSFPYNSAHTAATGALVTKSEGKVLAGWATLQNCSNVSSSFAMTADLDLYACWNIADSISIYRYENDGSISLTPTVFPSPKQVSVSGGSPFPAPTPTPQAVGYSFTHWGVYISSASPYETSTTTCTNPAQSATNLIGQVRVGSNGNWNNATTIVLHACWQAQSDVAVTFDAGTVLSATSGLNVVGSSQITEDDIPYGTPYPTSFDSLSFSAQGAKQQKSGGKTLWYTEDLCQGDAYTSDSTYYLTSSITLYACWEAVPDSTIVWRENLPTNPASSGTVANIPSTPTSVVHNATILAGGASPAVTPTLPGYTFAGWKVGSDAGADTFDFSSLQPGDSTINIYASWALRSDISVTFLPNAPIAEVTSMPANLTSLSFGADLDLTTYIPARNGFGFVGWYTCEVVDENDVNLCTTTTTTTTYTDPNLKVPANSLVLYAKWDPYEVNVVYTNNDATEMSALLGAAPTLPGNYTISIPGMGLNENLGAPASGTYGGFTFDGWYLDPTCSGLTSTDCSVAAASAGTFLDYFITKGLSDGDTINVYPKFTKANFSTSLNTGNLNYSHSLGSTLKIGDTVTIPEDAPVLAANDHTLTALEQAYTDGMYFIGFRISDYSGSGNFQSANANFRYFKDCGTLDPAVSTLLGNLSATCAASFTMPGGNVTLTAQYLPKDFSLKLYGNNPGQGFYDTGLVPFDYELRIYTDGKPIQMDFPSSPFPSSMPSGVSFLGWYECNTTPTDAGGGDLRCPAANLVSLAPTFMPARSLNMFAKWSPNMYKVRFVDNDSSITGTTDPPLGGFDDAMYGDVLHPTDYLSPLSRPGFTFLGWNKTSCGNLTSSTCSNLVKVAEPYETVPDVGDSGQTITYYAAWAYRNYSVTFSINNGNYSGEDAGMICVTHKRGGGELTTNYCNMLTSGVETLNLPEEPRYHKGDTLEITVTQGNSASLSTLEYNGSSGTFDIGTCVDSGSGIPSPCTAVFTVGTNNHTISTSFVPQDRTLIVQSSLIGGYIVADETHFNDGDPINLRAFANPGYAFDHWVVSSGRLNKTCGQDATTIGDTSENAIDDEGFVVGVNVCGDGDATISAVFTPLAQTINFWDMNGTSTPVAVISTCVTDVSCALDAAPNLTGQKAGYTFAGYYVANPTAFATSQSGKVFCAPAWSSSVSQCSYTSLTTYLSTVHLYASWIPNSGIILSFDLNYPGASGAPSNLTDLTFEDPLAGVFPANPSRSGYEFLGWRTCTTTPEPGAQCLEENKGTLVNASSTVPMVSTKLYAFWHEKEIKVRFSVSAAQSASLTSNSVTLTLPGYAVTSPSGTGWDDAHVGSFPASYVPSNYTGYDFLGWYQCSGVPDNFALSSASNCVKWQDTTAIADSYTNGDTIYLVADFAIKTFTIHHGNSFGDAGSWIELVDRTCVFNQECDVDVAAPTGYEGYVFAGWRVNSPTYLAEIDTNVYATDCSLLTVDISPRVCFETFPAMPPEDVFLIANRVPIRYNVTFDRYVESQYFTDVVTGIPAAFSGASAVSYRDTLPTTITSATPSRTVNGVEAYDFTGFQQARDSVDCSDRILTLRETMPAHDMLLCATWQPKAVSATFYAADNATVLRTSANNHFRDEVVPENVPASPAKSGYTFQAWNTGANGTGTDWNVLSRVIGTDELAGVQLYPRYTPNTQNVTFSLGTCASATPTWVSGTKSGSAATDASFTWQALSSEVSCKGSEFAGYVISGTPASFNGNLVAAEEEVTYTMPSGGFTATAQWTERTYDLVAKSQFVETIPTGTPREEDNPGTVQILVSDTPVTAASTQVLSTFNMGDTYKLVATPATGFTFSRWRIVTASTTCDPGETLPTNTVYFTNYSSNPTAELTVLACDMTVQAEFNAIPYELGFNASTTNYTNVLGHTFQGIEVEVFKNSVLQPLDSGQSFAVTSGFGDDFNILVTPQSGFELLSAQVVKDSDSAVLASCDNEVVGQECDFVNENPLEFDAVADDMHLEIVVDRISRNITLTADPNQMDATNGAYFGQVQIGNAQNEYQALDDSVTTTVKAFEVFSINAESYTNSNFNAWTVLSQGIILSDSGLCQGTNWETIEACRCEMPNFDVQVQANFTPIHYYLRLGHEDTTYGDPGVDDVGGKVKATITSDWKVGYPVGTVFETNAAPVQADIYAGKTYDVQAIPDTGFVFDHWTVNRVDQGVEICTSDSLYYINNGECPAGASLLQGLVKQPQNTVIKASFKRVGNIGTYTNVGAWDSSSPDLWASLPFEAPTPGVVALDDASQSITPASTPITFAGRTGENMLVVAPNVQGYTFVGFEGVYNDGTADRNLSFTNQTFTQAQSEQSPQEQDVQSVNPLDALEVPNPQAISIPNANTAQFAFPNATLQLKAVYAPVVHNFQTSLLSTYTGQAASNAGTLSVTPDYTNCAPTVCTAEVRAAKQYFAGMPLNITAAPLASWTFDHVGILDQSTQEETTISVSASMLSTANVDYTVKAYFRPDTYRLSFSSTKDDMESPHGYVAVYKMVGDLRLPVHSGDFVEHSAELYVSAESNAYYSHRFDSWSSPTGHLASFSSAASSSTRFTMPVGNAEILASFEPVVPTISILEAPGNYAAACDVPTLNTVSEVWVGEYICVRGVNFYDNNPDSPAGTPDPYPVNIELHSDPITLGMTTVNELGQFAIPVQVSSAEEAAALNLALDSQHDVVAYSDVFNEDLESSGFSSAFEAAQSASAAAKVNLLLHSGTRPGPSLPGSPETPGEGGGSSLPTPSFPNPGEPVPPGTVIPEDPDNPGGAIGSCSVEAWSKPNCLEEGGEWTVVPPAPPGAPIYADPRDPSGEMGFCSVPSYSKSDCLAKGGAWTVTSWGSGLVSTGVSISWALFLLSLLAALGVWLRRRVRSI